MAENKSISIFDAEQKVKELANKELIEYRVYELVQDLVNKYIGKVEEEFTITDENGDKCVGMWYDDVKEDAMNIIFERLDTICRAE